MIKGYPHFQTKIIIIFHSITNILYYNHMYILKQKHNNRLTSKSITLLK